MKPRLIVLASLLITVACNLCGCCNCDSQENVEMYVVHSVGDFLDKLNVKESSLAFIHEPPGVLKGFRCFVRNRRNAHWYYVMLEKGKDYQFSDSLSWDLNVLRATVIGEIEVRRPLSDLKWFYGRQVAQLLEEFQLDPKEVSLIDDPPGMLSSLSFRTIDDGADKKVIVRLRKGDGYLVSKSKEWNWLAIRGLIIEEMHIQSP